jgi:predicted dehydrogenase
VVAQSPRAVLAAVVDTDAARVGEAAAAWGAQPLTSADTLAGVADAAIVSAPTVAHAAIGCRLMEAGLDVLVEKPMAADLDGAAALAGTAARTGRVLQVGHLERFNPAVAALHRRATLPLFFEIHRLSVFTPRSLDIDVVLDLMIHDIDIVLHLVKTEPKDIRAAGISILSGKVDIANVRLEFENGCVANLTASRVSTDRVRKLRLFQPRQYLSLDYGRQELAITTVGAGSRIALEQAPITKAEPLALQFDAFLDAIAACRAGGPAAADGRTAAVTGASGQDGRAALKVAHAILDKIKEHAEVVSHTLVAGWKP